MSVEGGDEVGWGCRRGSLPPVLLEHRGPPRRGCAVWGGPTWLPGRRLGGFGSGRRRSQGATHARVRVGPLGPAPWPVTQRSTPGCPSLPHQCANTTSPVTSFISAPGPDDTVKLLAFADVGQYNEDGTKGFGYWYESYGLFDEFYAIGTLQYTVSLGGPGTAMSDGAGMISANWGSKGWQLLGVPRCPTRSKPHRSVPLALLQALQTVLVTLSQQADQEGTILVFPALIDEASTGEYHSAWHNGDVSYARGMAWQVCLCLRISTEEGCVCGMRLLSGVPLR